MLTKQPLFSGGRAGEWSSDQSRGSSSSVRSGECPKWDWWWWDGAGTMAAPLLVPSWPTSYNSSGKPRPDCRRVYGRSPRSIVNCRERARLLIKCSLRQTLFLREAVSAGINRWESKGQLSRYVSAGMLTSAAPIRSMYSYTSHYAVATSCICNVLPGLKRQPLARAEADTEQQFQTLQQFKKKQLQCLISICTMHTFLDIFITLLSYFLSLESQLLWLTCRVLHSVPRNWQWREGSVCSNETCSSNDWPK